jgi:ribosomal protein S18 acetylase RimI-like enzyme
MESELKVTEGIAPPEEAFILDRLKAFNIASFGESDRRELTAPVYGDEGELRGGLVGYTGRGWLYVSMLYIPEELRGRGLASRMLAMAEDEARKRGCIGVYLDTMNPAALKLYLKLDYNEIGRLDALADGHVITWLAKRL